LRAIGCVAAGFSLLLAAGCGGGDGADSSIAIHGGTPEQRALLQSIGDGLAPTGIRSVAVRTIEVVGFPSKTWVELSIRPKGGLRNTLRADWEMYVLAGAFRDRSAEAGLAAVKYFNGGYFALPRQDAAPSAAQVSPAGTIAIARAIERSAAEQRATVEQLTVFTPAAPAVVLVVRVDDPAAFVKDRFVPMVERWWTSRRLEGSRVIVLDRLGKLAFETMATTRLTASGSWIRPDLAGCYPFVHYGVGPNTEPPPPCPA
jgi:hypothetical protein